MAIRYPFVIIITLLVIIGIMFIFKKKIRSFKGGTKIANTSFIKSNEYFKKRLKYFKILSSILKSMCLSSIVICSILLSRVNKVETVNENEYKRDIFLCMDVSGSVDSLNYEISKNLQDIVKSLKGERFGISVFNASSVLLVPLTSDYDYILDSLGKLEKGFSMLEDFDKRDDDYFELFEYINSGTLEGNGGSLIGDGLATCVYSFPDLDTDKDRTRIIILSTDNDLAGTPLLTLDEAATIAKKKNVKIYGIATDTTTNKNGQAFIEATKKTGGEYYKQGNLAIKEIVKDIEKQSKSLIKDNTKTYQIDVPEWPFIILFIAIVILIFLDSKVIS